MALTEARVRTAKAKEQPYKLTDSDGLYLFVTTAGKKLWRRNYRHLGVQRTISFGSYPDLRLSEARAANAATRTLLTKGIDPIEHRQEEQTKAKLAAANTFAAVADEYIAKVRKQGLAKRTIDKKVWILNEIVGPKLGHRRIAEIRPREVLDVLLDIERSGRLETAKRARQNIGNVFRLAALSDRAPGDPTHLLHRQIKAPRVRSHPALIRPEHFGELLRKIEAYGCPHVRLALRFMALTFPRTIELRYATWDEIDLEDSVWTIPAERMKMRRPHAVPLAAQARGVLKEMVKVTGRRQGYIFPSPRSWRKVLSENTLGCALHDLGFKDRHTPHGFRSSASSILNGTKRHRREVIEIQLAHLDENEVRRTYNRFEYWDERVELMRDWGQIVKELRAPAVAMSP